MKIYLDLLLLLNFIYDGLLLITVSVALKRNTCFKRILLGSLFGSLSTLIILLPLNKYLLFILKIASGLIMLIITFSYHNFKYFLNNLIYLYMCSVILAGFLVFLKIEFNNLSYVLILLISPFILYVYLKEQKNLKEIVNYHKNVTITLKNNRTLNLKGFIDSGNTLKDPVTHKYIILINKNKLKGIYNIRSPMYVPINTVSSHSLLECISIKNIQIDNKVYTNYLLGLSSEFTRKDEADCLLNYHILEEE